MMNRRLFLKSTVALAAASRFAAALPAADSAKPARPRIKIGFLGAAHSHALPKVKVVQESPDYELVGICEDSEKDREPYSGMGVRFLSQEALLKDCAVVAVESAVRDHARHGRLALQAGKHLHIEKPGADSLKAFEELVVIARDKKLLLQVGYMWRHNPGLNAALEAARKGWLGQIYLIRAMINTWIAPDRRPEWAEFKGGAMFELGCHMIDPMVRLLGRPKSVTPILRQNGKAITPFLKKHGNFADDLADNTVAVLGFGSALGIVGSNTLQPNAFPHRSWEILGTNGTAVLKPIEPPALQIDLAETVGPYTAGSNSVSLPSYRRYVGDFAELAAAVRGERSLYVSLDEELAVQETLIRACEM